MVKEGLRALHIEEANVDRDKDKKLTFEEAQKAAQRVKKRYPVFSELKAVDGGSKWNYYYAASPGKF